MPYGFQNTITLKSGMFKSRLKHIKKLFSTWVLIDYFPIAHSTLCLPPNFGKMQYSQEHLKTMVYAEFGGQTECIMGNWKIENYLFHPSAFPSLSYFSLKLGDNIKR